MNERISQFAGAYREWLPELELRDHIRCLWVNDLTRASIRQIHIVPDGCVDILWSQRGLRVAGPDTHFFVEEVQDNDVITGVRFHPGAAHAWLGIPLSELVNQRVPLDELWKDDSERLSCELSVIDDEMTRLRHMQQVLLSRLPRVGPPDHSIDYVRRTIRTRGNLAAFASEIGWSERTLRRRCMDAFGYGLKTFERILRFQNFFELAQAGKDDRHGRGLADLAMEAGYADQCHLTREVQRLSGLTASQFVAQLKS